MKIDYFSIFFLRFNFLKFSSTSNRHIFHNWSFYFFSFAVNHPPSIYASPRHISEEVEISLLRIRSRKKSERNGRKNVPSSPGWEMRQLDEKMRCIFWWEHRSWQGEDISYCNDLVWWICKIFSRWWPKMKRKNTESARIIFWIR